MRTGWRRVRIPETSGRKQDRPRWRSGFPCCWEGRVLGGATGFAPSRCSFSRADSRDKKRRCSGHGWSSSNGEGSQPAHGETGSESVRIKGFATEHRAEDPSWPPVKARTDQVNRNSQRHWKRGTLVGASSRMINLVRILWQTLFLSKEPGGGVIFQPNTRAKFLQDRHLGDPKILGSCKLEKRKGKMTLLLKHSQLVSIRRYFNGGSKSIYMHGEALLKNKSSASLPPYY